MFIANLEGCSRSLLSFLSHSLASSGRQDVKVLEIAVLSSTHPERPFWNEEEVCVCVLIMHIIEAHPFYCLTVRHLNSRLQCVLKAGEPYFYLQSLFKYLFIFHLLITAKGALGGAHGSFPPPVFLSSLQPCAAGKAKGAILIWS